MYFKLLRGVFSLSSNDSTKLAILSNWFILSLCSVLTLGPSAHYFVCITENAVFMPISSIFRECFTLSKRILINLFSIKFIALLIKKHMKVCMQKGY